MGDEPEVIEPVFVPAMEPAVATEPLEEPEQIRQQMEETREQLAEKVGLLENRISGAVESVTHVLDIRKHVQEHPWLAVGVAAAAGWATGWVMGRWLWPAHYPAAHYIAGDGAVRPVVVGSAPRPGLFGELSQIAGAALRGVAYELSSRAVPLAVDALLAANETTTPAPAAAPAVEPADVLPFGAQRPLESRAH